MPAILRRKWCRAARQIKSGRRRGNIRYEYFFPMDDPCTVLLIDEWKNEEAIDLHHKSEMMETVASLRKKYKLKMRVERFITEK